MGIFTKLKKRSLIWSASHFLVCLSFSSHGYISFTTGLIGNATWSRGTVTIVTYNLIQILYTGGK